MARTSPPLHVPLHASPALATVAVIAHAGAFACLVLARIDPAAVAAVTVVLLVSGRHALREALRRGPRACVALWRGGDTWRLARRDGRLETADAVNARLVHRYLVVLDVRLPWGRDTVAIPADGAPPEAAHRLRRLLLSASVPVG